MSLNSYLADACAAVIIFAIVLVVEPGVAIAAILALILLVVCAISYLVGRRPRRPRRRTRRGSSAVASRPGSRRR